MYVYIYRSIDLSIYRFIYLSLSLYICIYIYIYIYICIHTGNTALFTHGLDHARDVLAHLTAARGGRVGIHSAPASWNFRGLDPVKLLIFWGGSEGHGGLPGSLHPEVPSLRIFSSVVWVSPQGILSFLFWSRPGFPA